MRLAMFLTIKTLWQKGRNKSEISRQTGHDWKTINKMVKQIQKGKEYPESKKKVKKLDLHKERILELLEEGLSGLRIYEELSREGIKASYSTVKNYVRYLKRKQNIFVRMHTEPGEEAQVDFGYAGYTLDNNGKRRKTWVFNMRLSYSRLDYYEAVYDQKVETFINCHINAFNFFGGVPECVKIDNLKAAILKANFYEPIYQQHYKDFANYYGFQPLPCRIYKPNDKGKVECGIKYVKNNFFSGRKFKDRNDLDLRLKKWLTNTCNQRIHGTTKKIPIEVFEKKEKLKKLPLKDFAMAQVGTRKVYHDCHIYVNHNYYSVPFEYVGKQVEIECSQGLLRIRYHNKIIAVHPELTEKGNFSTNDKHYPKYKCMSQTEYQEKYQVKMAAIGSYAEQMFFLLLKKQTNYWNKTVQGILSLTKSYPNEIVNMSCKRALAYEVCSYLTIKNICNNGSYKLPVEF